MIEVIITLAVWSILRESKLGSGLIQTGAELLDGLIRNPFRDSDAQVKAESLDLPEAEYRIISEGKTEAERGMALYGKRAYRQAIPHLQSALVTYPGDEGLTRALADAAVQVGDVNVAIQTLRGGTAHNRDWGWGYGACGDLYYRKRWYEAAVESYREAIRCEPQAEDWQYRLAIALRDQGGHEAEAAAALDRLLVINPLHLEGICLRAAIAYELGDYSAAQQDYQVALEHAGPNREITFSAHVGLAGILGNVGELEGAQVHARRATELFPELPQGHLFLAYTMLRRREYRQAHEVLVTLPGKEQVIATWHAYVGYAHLGLGQTAEAYTAFQAAVQIEPRSAEAHHGLSLYYKLQGRLGLAEREFEAAMVSKAPGQKFVEFEAVAMDDQPLKFGEIEVVASHYLGDETAVFHRGRMPNGTAVLVKELNAYFASQPTYVQALQREIGLTRRLAHDHIAGILADGVDPLRRRYYFVMEDLGAGTLRDLLLRDGRLSVDRTRRIGRQIALGLAYCHSIEIQPKRHVVHRALRPESILMGAGDMVKIGDFGRAKASGTFASGGGATGGGTFSDPTYLAPEILEGLKVDPRADQYSFACILYEMATGAPPHPFDGKDVDGYTDMKLDQAPPSVASLAPDLPPALAAAIDRSLAVDRDARFDRVSELLAVLEG